MLTTPLFVHQEAKMIWHPQTCEENPERRNGHNFFNIAWREANIQGIFTGGYSSGESNGVMLKVREPLTSRPFLLAMLNIFTISILV